MPKLLLVDGHSLFHRAFFALPRLSAGGRPTGAVYGFLSMLLRLVETERPDAVVVCLDTAAPTFRHHQFAAYKAQRPGMPDELQSQLPLWQEVMEALGLSTLAVEGYEADDVIGCAASRAGEQGYEVVIVTGDRDVLQLVGPGVRALLTRRGISELESYDECELERALGVTPRQLIDVKGLMGDSSDNIPGVPGIGEKRALALVKEFGSLEGALARLDEVKPPSVREALRTHAEQARLSRELATIRCELPLDLEGVFRPMEPDPRRVSELFSEYQFRSLLPRLGLKGRRSEGETSAPPCVWPASLQEVRAVLEATSAGHPLCVYAWPSGGARWQPVAAAFAAGSGPVACARLDGEGLTPAMVVAAAAEALGPGAELIAHDAKPWVVEACRRSLATMSVPFDTVLAAYLIDPTRSSYRLEDLAREHLNRELPASPPDRGVRVHKTLGDAEARGQLLAHLGSAVRMLPELRVALTERLQSEGLERLYYEVELPLVAVLADMEAAGIAVDLDRARDMAAEFGSSIDRLAEGIYRLAGEEFNINSTRQLGEVLFGKLGLPAQKKTKTGYSTDAEVLEALAPNHEIAARILEYRQLVKLKGTYLDGIETLVDPATGRLHTTFNQAVTATGRLSSAEPNLQNIPVRFETGRMIRRIFVAPAETVLLAADYSQIELRVLAHLADAATMLEAFARGEDIHARTAAEVFGVPLDQVTPELRGRAKAVNFGIVYGISDYGLARDLGVSRAEARAYIESYLARYPEIKAYMERVVKEGRREGAVRTLLGRKRQLPDINARNPALRHFAERTAINTPVQGTAADIIKSAMVAIHRELRARRLASRMLLQVHDELILEVPQPELAPVARLVRQQMENAVELAAPLKVDLKTGPTWYDLRPYDCGEAL